MANQVGVLGPMRIQRDDRSEVDAGGKRQRRLLAPAGDRAATARALRRHADVVAEVLRPCVWTGALTVAKPPVARDLQAPFRTVEHGQGVRRR